MEKQRQTQSPTSQKIRGIFPKNTEAGRVNWKGACLGLIGCALCGGGLALLMALNLITVVSGK